MGEALAPKHYIAALIVLLAIMAVLAVLALHRRLKLKKQQCRRAVYESYYHRDLGVGTGSYSSGSLGDLEKNDISSHTPTTTSYAPSQIYSSPPGTTPATPIISLPSAPPPAAHRSLSTPTLSSSSLASRSEFEPYHHTDTERRGGEMSTLRLSSSTFGPPGGGSNDSASFLLFPVPTTPARSRTDRQVLIENEIQMLQAKLVWMQSQGRVLKVNGEAEAEVNGVGGWGGWEGWEGWEEQMKSVECRIEMLKGIHESDWAVGRSEDIPIGFI